MFWKRQTPIVTDPARIDAFLNRGLENVFPNKDFVRAKMLKGEKLSMYLGVDPTGPTLHLGHVIPIKKLQEFQKLGHQAILLIGDFTGMIGDPTDKSATRKKLTRDQVLENSRLYKEQASKFLDFTGPNKALIKYNNDWLGKMNFAEVLELASHMTVDQMLKRDMFEKRIQAGQPIHIHEFLYPLLQGYDSVAMNVDGEVGGNDQTFNMLAGRDLSKSLNNKEKFVIASKLLVDSSGKKMGKTEGNMVSLNQTPDQMFGNVMSWTDGLIIPGLEICTDIALDEIRAIEQKLKEGMNPRDAKIILAKAIVTMCYNSDAADKAEKNFSNTFKDGAMPEDAQKVVVTKGEKLVEILVREKTVESKSEFRRLIESNAISVLGGDTITSPDYVVDSSVKIKVGKRRFISIEVK